MFDMMVTELPDSTDNTVNKSIFFIRRMSLMYLNNEFVSIFTTLS